MQILNTCKGFFFILVIIITNTLGFNACLAKDITYYRGFDIGYKCIPLDPTFGGNIFPENFTNITGYLGFKNLNFGAELGLQYSFSHNNFNTVYRGDVVCGNVVLPPFNNIKYVSNANIFAVNFDAYAFNKFNVNNRLRELEFYLGIGLGINKAVYDREIMQISNTYYKHKNFKLQKFKTLALIPRCKLGLISESFNKNLRVKAEILLETTEKFNDISNYAIPKPSKIKCENSLSFNLGLIFNL